MGFQQKVHNLFHKPKVLEPRTLYYNQPLPAEAIDPKHQNRPLKVYDKNEIRTTKYTPFSFIPKNLFFQFQNIANIYFLFLIIIGAFQIFGVENPGVSAVPLVIIVVITAVKDAFEDSRRTISDLELNNNPISILSGIHNPNVDDTNIPLRSKFNNYNATIFVKMIKFFGKLFGKKTNIATKLDKSNYGRNSLDTFRSDQRFSIDTNNNNNNDIPQSIVERLNTTTTNQPRKSTSSNLKFKKRVWRDVKAGDIVRVHGNEEAPADIIILSTSDPDNKCFVETKNLDGETNLKSRQGLHQTSQIKRSKDLENLQFIVKSEAPNLNMYNYQGSFNWFENEEHFEEAINVENLVLRGSTVRNTKWVIGYVVFTGHETKIMLNSGVTPSKISRISKELNLSVIINFFFLFILCFAAGVVNGVFYGRSDTSFKAYEFNAYGKSPAVSGIIQFFVSMNIYQALVPISLYITVEIIKTAQAYFIFSDVEMYYEKLDYPCTPKSWNISDDLGQIEYIFSDKTGTLTQNVMEFKKATVNGKSYGLAYTEAQAGMDKRKGIDTEVEVEKWTNLIAQDREDMVQELSNFPENDQFNRDKVTFVSSEFVKDLKSNGDKAQRDANYEFMLSLAVCHTVLTEPSKDDPSKLEFKAESPDEAALVQAASDVGFTFLQRNRNGGTVRIHGEEKQFEILRVLAFNSTRKRMSVIVRIDGTIKIITKGADSVIYARLDSTKNDKALLQKTADYLEEFASEGLRTLCIAGREVSEDEFQKFIRQYESAASSLENRDERIEEASNLIERDFVLYGGTAIEDRLQLGVPESIEKLGQAGIKLWVLTGDKIETAINIGFSCNLLGNDMTLLVIRPDENSDSPDDVNAKLDEYLGYFQMTGSKEELKQAKKDHSIPTANYAVIIEGSSLGLIFEDKDLQRKFLLLCKQCKSVLCCRVSPAQKALVVKLVRDSLNVMTLAIGDGANDVSMIQTANVGVGIVGEEGRQAAMSSDYAIGQFKYLVRLILVHGRWDYKRLAEVIPVFFYKNVTFTLSLFWYGIYSDFDGSYLLQYTIIMFYNLAFTSLPIILLGVFDQDVSADISLRVPQLYKTGILRQEWSQYKFLYYMIDGIYQSVISFYFPFLLFYKGHFASYNGLNIDHRFWMGTFVTHISVTACDIYTLLRQKRWDYITLIVNAISILLVFFWIGIYSSFTSSSEFYKNAVQVYGNLSFWVTFFSGVVACLLPRFSLSTLNTIFRPRDIDIIRECVSKGDFAEGGEFKDLEENSFDQEKEISNDGSSQGVSRNSLERVQTTRDLPGLTQAQSLVKTFTQSSSLKH